MAIRKVSVKSIISSEVMRELRAKDHDIRGVKIDLPNIHSEPMLRSVTKPEYVALYYINNDETSYEGCVVDVISRTERYMFDSWAKVTYAVVYEPTNNGAKCFRQIVVGNSEMMPLNEVMMAQVDASPELQEIYEVYKMGHVFRDKEMSYDQAEEKDRLARRRVEPGKTVRVVKGRKVPVGTEGKVFWAKPTQWGEKVGIAIPQEDGTYRVKNSPTGRKFYQDVQWTYAKNCVVIRRLGGPVL